MIAAACIFAAFQPNRCIIHSRRLSGPVGTTSRIVVAVIFLKSHMVLVASLLAAGYKVQTVTHYNIAVLKKAEFADAEVQAVNNNITVVLVTGTHKGYLFQDS